MKKLALHWRILLGMILGIIFGLLMIQFEWGPGFVVDWIKPWGTIFINLLKLIAIPLIIASLIKGISDLDNISQLSKMGTKTLGLYIISTALAVSIGLVIVNVVSPGRFIQEQTRTELMQSFGGDASKRVEATEKDQSRDRCAR
jgi:Na+/H+-dicarboxylate symporter